MNKPALCTTTQSVSGTFGVMPRATSEMAEWKRCVGKRLKELRATTTWSLSDVERELAGRLPKSTLGNYEQGTRLPGRSAAEMLGRLYKVPSFYILCLEEGPDVVLFEQMERRLIRDFRALPEKDRAEYARRIAALATAYRDPVPDERVGKHIPAIPRAEKSK
jgi:transcriptional regulator with XRE-family HTH domain